jgi:hypothetical protein
MSQSIIETAVTNRTLGLELTYQAPSMFLEENDDDTAELEAPPRLVPPPRVQPISGEFACLLSVI